jgi:hypothetical protein
MTEAALGGVGGGGGARSCAAGARACVSAITPKAVIVVCCFLATFSAYVERVGFSIAFTAMAKAAGLDEAVKGNVLAAFYWGYGVSQVRCAGWRGKRAAAAVGAGGCCCRHGRGRQQRVAAPGVPKAACVRSGARERASCMRRRRAATAAPQPPPSQRTRARRRSRVAGRRSAGAAAGRSSPPSCAGPPHACSRPARRRAWRPSCSRAWLWGWRRAASSPRCTPCCHRCVCVCVCAQLRVPGVCARLASTLLWWVVARRQSHS